MEIKWCKRCGKDWCFRGEGRPLRCGKCKSPYWDQEKINEGNGENSVRVLFNRIEPSTRSDLGDGRQNNSEVAIGGESVRGSDNSWDKKGISEGRVTAHYIKPEHAANCKCGVCSAKRGV